MTERGCLDIRADLQNEDETGYVWAFLRRAVRPDLIEPGAKVIAGNSAARVVARVVDVVDGPGGRIVHLELLPDSVQTFEQQRHAVA